MRVGLLRCISPVPFSDMPPHSLHVRYQEQSGKHLLAASISPFDPERRCGLGAAYHVLPPALLHPLIVLTAAPAGIASLRVRIGLEKEAEAAVAPGGAPRNGYNHRTAARHEATRG